MLEKFVANLLYWELKQKRAQMQQRTTETLYYCRIRGLSIWNLFGWYMEKTGWYVAKWRQDDYRKCMKMREELFHLGWSAVQKICTWSKGLCGRSVEIGGIQDVSPHHRPLWFGVYSGRMWLKDIGSKGQSWMSTKIYVAVMMVKKQQHCKLKNNDRTSFDGEIWHILETFRTTLLLSSNQRRESSCCSKVSNWMVSSSRFQVPHVGRNLDIFRKKEVIFCYGLGLRRRSYLTMQGALQGIRCND